MNLESGWWCIGALHHTFRSNNYKKLLQFNQCKLPNRSAWIWARKMENIGNVNDSIDTLTCYYNDVSSILCLTFIIMILSHFVPIKDYLLGVRERFQSMNLYIKKCQVHSRIHYVALGIRWYAIRHHIFLCFCCARLYLVYSVFFIFIFRLCPRFERFFD